MRDLHKNPVLYYVLIPLLVGTWPLFMWFKYLPQVNEGLRQQKQDMVDANDLIYEILTMDPDRLSDAKNSQGETVEFSYGAAINQVAKTCGITPPRLDEDGKTVKSQAAGVKLKDVDIVKCARFLSTLQLHWSKLQCTRISLTAMPQTRPPQQPATAISASQSPSGMLAFCTLRSNRLAKRTMPPRQTAAT